MEILKKGAYMARNVSLVAIYYASTPLREQHSHSGVVYLESTQSKSITKTTRAEHTLLIFELGSIAIIFAFENCILLL